MTEMIKIGKGNPHPYGITPTGQNCINIAISMQSEDCGIVLYYKNENRQVKVPFSKEFCIGELYCVTMEGIDPSICEYCFYEDDRLFVDVYARSVAGNEKYGKHPDALRGRFVRDVYDWEGDGPLSIPYHESIFYLLHVRGFTKHKSSGVSARGTFSGIAEKLPYLKTLGITAVELMPAYEFTELEERFNENERIPMAYRNTEPVLNYWGYKEGFYYAPKSAYATEGGDPVKEFKDMVKLLHANGIEVLMQFYFPDSVSGLHIADILRYWVCEYHIDGFHLMGDNVPSNMLALDPLLKRTKLIYYGFQIAENANWKPNYKNLAACRNEYMYDMRRLLKSDERMLGKVLQHMKRNPKGHAIVHYMTETNGFTLADLVSYDRKHNEDNGENNLDGNPYNASWNCGAEGKTRKKPVMDLRLKQMKNAYLLSLFTQSTPLLLAGDEFANSQGGNNNAYCQDNITSWLNWDDMEKQQELFAFVKELIAFRKEHALLHRSTEYTMLDELACGYPDLSYHSEEPWKCPYDDLTRHFGVLYCGEYSEEKGEKNTFIFLAVNTHWVPHEFALPTLPSKRKWKTVFDTSQKGVVSLKQSVKKDRILVKERSIQVLVAEGNE